VLVYQYALWCSEVKFREESMWYLVKFSENNHGKLVHYYESTERTEVQYTKGVQKKTELLL
jgi:hypothetical protein